VRLWSGIYGRAKGHVAQGLQFIAEQLDIVAQFERNGWDATRARELLATYEDIQKSHEGDRDRLKRDLAALDKKSD
jgi:hypothetical protein